MTSLDCPITVVIPARNRAATLLRAIRSVQAQGIDHLEIIVVDDASTDDTASVVRGLGDPRIRLLQHSDRRGGSAARNTGIRAARGKFIALLDSDDEWLAGKLSAELESIQAAPASVGLICTGYERVAPDGAVEPFVPSVSGDMHRRMLFEGNLLRGATSSALIRRECFDVAGLFDESLPAAQDYDLWVRITKHFEVRLISEVLVRVFADMPDRISIDLEAKERASRILSERYRDEMTALQYRWRKARRLARAAYRWYLGGDSRRARRLVLSALRVWPLSGRGWLYGIVSLLNLRMYLRLRSVLRPFRNPFGAFTLRDDD
jgi:glycosyltransferase involved in cell wall biosynthesis